jgi:hypothetical protein
MLTVTETQKTFTVRHTLMPYKKVQHVSVYQSTCSDIFVCTLTRKYLTLSKGILKIFGLKMLYLLF